MAFFARCAQRNSRERVFPHPAGARSLTLSAPASQNFLCDASRLDTIRCLLRGRDYKQQTSLAGSHAPSPALVRAQGIRWHGRFLGRGVRAAEALSFLRKNALSERGTFLVGEVATITWIYGAFVPRSHAPHCSLWLGGGHLELLQFRVSGRRWLLRIVYHRIDVLQERSGRTGAYRFQTMRKNGAVPFLE